MRRRSRGSLIPTTSLVHWTKNKKSDDTLVSQGSYAAPVPCNLEWSQIEDDDSKRSGKLKRTRACTHVRETYCALRRTTRYNHPTEANYYNDVACYFPAGSFTEDFGSLPHGEALDFFASGCQEQELLLPNLFMEFKSTASTFDFLAKGSFKKLKQYADAHLAWEFGIKPYLSDLEKIHGFLFSIKDRLAWLRKNQGKPVKVSFSKDVSSNFVRGKQGHVVATESEWWTTPTIKVQYRAYALLTYDLEALSDLELEARMLARAFGFDNPLGVVWEAIPYSFIVDWFFKIGDFLDNFTKKITLPYKFLDVGYTVKVSESLETYLRYRYPVSPTGPFLTGTRTRNTFVRRAGLPVAASSIASGSPGLKQLALSLSLFAQKSGK